MTDLTGKSWMAIGETDDVNVVIVSFEAAAQVTNGDPVYLSADDKVSPAAAAFATIIQNSLNISFGTFLALTGVGIAVIVAAAAAMYSFANSMNSATASVQSFNESAAETPASSRSIRRTGDDALYRRGVE